MLQIILVQSFCPLKSKIIQFRNGFRLNFVSFPFLVPGMMISFGSIAYTLM